MPQDSLPALAVESSQHARKIADDLHARLVALSQQIAAANKNDNIQCSDVNKALYALKRAGLEPPPPWYCRPAFFVGLGTLLAGISPSIAGVFYTAIQQPEHPYWFALAVLVIPALLAGIGVTMAAFGWISDRD